MRAELKPHPDTPSHAAASIEVDVERPWKHALKFTYTLRGDLGAIRLPAPAEPKQVDGLWRTTCFEAFLRDPGGKGYCEFNFSPSTEYAIYEFDAYREGMKGGHCSRAELSTKVEGDCFELIAGVNFQRASRVRGDGALQLGLSAVIEEANGVKSYWALKHPPGKPDFHHADGFVLELP